MHPVLWTNRLLVLLAVLGSFLASATLQVFGLLRAIAVAVELVQGGSVSAAVGKGLIADTVAIIDIFLVGTALLVISTGLYQLFVRPDLELPDWLTMESLDDLKHDLMEVIIVALLVAFLGQAIEWTNDVAILGLGASVAAVILAVAALTWAAQRGSDGRPTAAARRDDVEPSGS
jgi:uncharacterized membrane protein YqhA